ncbi:MAG: DNA replication/repair protein RecF [Hyphomicrobiales bacterium]
MLSVTQLTLTQFRNYDFMRLETAPSPVVLCGENGAGKTNILEALSLLAPGRGLRGNAFSELCRSTVHGAAEGWGVAADVNAPLGEVKLGTGWRDPDIHAGQPSGRQVQIDGAMQKGSGALGAYMRAIWLTPAMDRLFTGPASDRRRFVDRLTGSFDAHHGAQVHAFEKLMRERNRLLDSGERTGAWLDGVELQMAEAAVAVAAARKAAIDALTPVLAASKSGYFPWVELSLEGELENSMAECAAVDVEEDYRRTLAENRERDAAAGRALNGPHRSDIAVVHGPKGLEARYCSTGEQKALLIGIVLAHAHVIQTVFSGFAPLLLLDEVAAHLDEHRRAGLFEEISKLGAQAWMTGTDTNLFEAASGQAQFFTVTDGKVTS